MKVVITYCSGPKRKDGGLLPAVDRYLSRRIRTLYQEATASAVEFRILSGEFGLVAADQPIPWYDHLLSVEEIGELTEKVAAGLTGLRADTVEYHTADPALFPDVAPYQEVIEAACRVVGMNLEIFLLFGDPD
ncbi:MAG: hypothetical protein KOO60_04780 [Gemmatimonadales bacterium]|nr:hypothetical protein [Gemmatimonadales bacterium]